MGRPLELEGQIFGRLTVVGKDPIHEKGKGIRWLCKCSCEENSATLKSISGSNLVNGHVRSCGCIQREIVKKSSKKYNTYDLTGEYGIGYTSKNEEFYFDLEDYEKIKDYCWCISKGCVVATNLNGDDKQIFFHRLIMNPKEEELVDHIFHNTNDNRKSKLRIVTNSQNQMNSVLNIKNTSGCKGVIWHNRDKCWFANIRVNGKRIHLGSFKNKEDAIKARKEAENKYHGEYSYDNSMKLAGE